MKTNGLLYPLLLTGLISLVISTPLFSQSVSSKTISGVVTDDGTGDPLPGVNVYISMSSVGTATDVNGRYEFTSTLTGRQTVVMTMLGYQSQTFAIDLNSSQQRIELNADLEAESLDMENVLITASRDVVWERNLREFQNQFIGNTSLSDDTIIENPWVLDFGRDNSGQFVAKAPVPLSIINNALGYHIHVELQEFKWNSNGVEGMYMTQIRFEEMTPANSQEQRRWETNRERAYRGSLRHFLASLYEGHLISNQFAVVRPSNNSPVHVDELEVGELRLRMMESGIRSDNNQNIKGFRLPAQVDVLYGRFTLPVASRMRSSLTPRYVYRDFFVTSGGELLDPQSLSISGNWQSHRIANMLPLDYKPD